MSPTTPPPKLHWAVRMNRRNRSWSYVLLLVITVLHLGPDALTLLEWLVCAGAFLLYPQLAYFRARRSANPMPAEMLNMRLDLLICGFWMATLHFPLWPSFAFLTGTTLNLAAFKGAKGYLQSLGLAAMGAAGGLLLEGEWQFSPDTSVAVTALSMITATLYLLIRALEGHHRSERLYQARKELREKEQSLQSQLEEIRALQAQLQAQADRDPLTGLYNRRYLSANFERELARCARQGTGASVMVIDADHFKQINDTHGHAAGDAVLVRLGELVRARTRSTDIACRFGGEEFVLIEPGVSPERALEKAEELRRLCATESFNGREQTFGVTVSIGLAHYPQDGETPDELILAADAALYRAKAQGRDRVVENRADFLR